MRIYKVLVGGACGHQVRVGELRLKDCMYEDIYFCKSCKKYQDVKIYNVIEIKKKGG